MTDAAVPRADLAPGDSIAAMPRVRYSADAVAMAGLAMLSGVLYLVNLTVSGFANTYYAMAAQAASQSWSALFFGALDSHGFITVDKPPLATAVLGLSVRLFGLSSWAILLPQALLGVGTVLVLYIAVRRSFGSRAAVLAGVFMALSPVAVLIFRYDNPDALLTFLLVVAAWALGRGLEGGRIRWAVLAATLIGLAFLTKYLQAWVVLPALALTWFVSAPGSVRRRLAGLVASAIAVILASLWWVALVELIPAAERPFIGGSQANSVIDLLLGYDGLGRIFSMAGGDGAPGTGGGGGFGGDPGLLRLFNDAFGGQIAWLLPAAALSIVAAVVIHRRAARTDRRVAGYVLWGTWLIVHALVFSFMAGIIHPYYSVAMAPAIAALIGAAAVELWDRRAGVPARLALAVGLVATGLAAWALLERTPSFVPGLGIGALGLSLAAALLVVIPPGAVRPLVGRAVVTLALAATLAGPVAYAGATMETAYSGGDPAAGPQGAGGFGGPGGFGAGGPGGGTVSQALVDYLVANQGSARWIVAANTSLAAAPIQLASGQPVMTMGGFNGSDPAPTLAELQAAIRSGELRYVLVSGGPGGGFAPDGGFGGDGTGFGPGGGQAGGPGGNAVAAARSAWVTSTCSQVTIDGSATALYDCAGAAG